MLSKTFEAEFLRFAQLNRPRLMAQAYIATGDWHAAEDVVQEALIRVASRWRQVREGNVTAYTRRVLYTEAMDYHRRQRREARKAPLHPKVSEGGMAAADDRDQLLHLLEDLTAHQRAVLALRYVADLTQEEAAHVLNISPGSVTRITHEAIARIRRNESRTASRATTEDRS